MSNYIFLIDSNKRAMNPVHPSHARKLLDSGKAAVFRRYPFTIILHRAVENIITFPLSLKIDPGSITTGIALVTSAGEVIWGMELTHRGQAIKDFLLKSSAIRQGRRSRHTRYRQSRFLNRTRPKGWLAPSQGHRVLTTMTWVKKLIAFAPIGSIVTELVRFDLQKLENPEISSIEYQQGELLGYEVREYLLNKWDRRCTYCDKTDIPLQVEHIHPKAKGGTNRISNLALACEKCNRLKGTTDISQFLAKKPDLLKRVLAQAKRPLIDAAAVNSTTQVLFNRLKETGLPVSTGSGGQTKFNRTRLGLPKAHWIDYACVGLVETLKVLTTKILVAHAIGKGTRRLCRIDKFGFPCSKPRQKYPIPWQTGDIALSMDGIVGRVVIQSAIRLEVRVNNQRHGGKICDFKKLHSKDGYRYA